MSELEEELFVALKNAEGQYSLWPHSKSVPGGWEVASEAMSRTSCLNLISETWKDMRPLSLVQRMASAAE